jgi:hypothetical protein
VWGKLFRRPVMSTKKLAASFHTFTTPYASRAPLFVNTPAQKKAELEYIKTKYINEARAVHQLMAKSNASHEALNSASQLVEYVQKCENITQLEKLMQQSEIQQMLQEWNDSAETPELVRLR